MKSKSNQQTFIAFHEAGHAVAACLVDRYPKEVTIIPSEENFGYCSYTPMENYHPDTSIDRRTTLLTKKRIFTLVAGYIAADIAHMLWKGGTNKSKIMEKRFDIELPSLKLIPDDSRHDLAKALELASYLVGDTQTAVAFVEFMWFFAGDVLRFYWPCVEAVAVELLNKRTLTKEEIKKAFVTTSVQHNFFKKIEMI